jgi:predicted deacetylase
VPVHVSIHDVTPAHAADVELALARCAAVGARPALLVVPNFHGLWPLADHPEFCARLRELQQEGHEVYLHGYFHKSSMASLTGDDAGRAQGLRRVFTQKVVSAGEAEFSDVSVGEARERVEKGEAVLERAGLRIDGFVAPAWSMPRWMHDVLSERGYRFTEDHLRVYDPQQKRARPTVLLNYASRTPGRLASSVLWCRAAKRARALLPARIAIHPGDMRHPLLRHEVDVLLEWARGDLARTGRELLS